MQTVRCFKIQQIKPSLCCLPLLPSTGKKIMWGVYLHCSSDSLTKVDLGYKKLGPRVRTAKLIQREVCHKTREPKHIPSEFCFMYCHYMICMIHIKATLCNCLPLKLFNLQNHFDSTPTCHRKRGASQKHIARHKKSLQSGEWQSWLTENNRTTPQWVYRCFVIQNSCLQLLRLITTLW